jgi:hypothetical protein
MKLKRSNLIDPDVVSILSVSLAGIGAFCGIYQIYALYDDREKKDRQFKTDLRGFRENIREVKRSIRFFYNNIERLESLLKKVNLRGEKEEDILKLPVKYGVVSMYLYDYEVEIYISIQDSIYESLRRYSINLTSLSEFLSLHYISSEKRLLFKSELGIAVDKINALQKSEITIGEYIELLKKISVYIHAIINEMEKYYIEQ